MIKAAALGCFLPILLSLSAVAQERLTVLSPHWEGIRYEFERAFKRRYLMEEGASISFVWLDVGATSEIVRFVEAEFQRKAEGIGVDLVFGGGIDPFEEFKRKSLLVQHRLPEELLRVVPPAVGGSPLYDGDFFWYAPTMSVFGIICNEVVLRRLKLNPPRNWEDLTKPEYFSWITLADPRKSGSAHMAYEIILQAYGWEEGWRILYALAGNARSVVAHASQAAKDVADGEAACSLVIDSSARALMRLVKADEMSFIIPADATVINGDGLAILKGAPNLKAAKKFLEFMLSEEAQKIWLYKAGLPGGPARYTLSRFAVLPSLYKDLGEKSEIQVNPFEWQAKFRYDASKGSRRWNALNYLLGVFLLDSQPELYSRRRIDLASGAASRGPVKDAWTAPLEEEVLNEMAANNSFDDPLAKNQIIQEWRKKAAVFFPPSKRIGYWLQIIPLLLIALLFAGWTIFLRYR